MKNPSEIEMQDLMRPVVSEDVIPTIEVTDSQGQKRFVGLTDIDHTLANSEAGGRIVLNMKLLNALKAKGIKDLYLFTDMLLLPFQIKDRLYIIQELEREGFTVHGVITPIDYFWTSDPVMINVLEKFEEAMRKASISFKKNALKNIDKLQEVLAQFPEITERTHSDPNVGHAFKEAAESYQRGDDIAQLTNRSILCKVAIDVISYLRGFESCKGIMCQQFIAHLPEWVLACFVFEDNEDHITSVKQCISPNVPLFAIHGEFTIKGGDTFVANFAPYLANTSYASNIQNAMRMGDLVSLALMKMKDLQQGAPFGGLRYKKEYAQAESLFTKIVACNDDFEKQWGCVSAHLKSLPKSFSGAYQFSVFDNLLLELLSADVLICKGVDALNKNQSEPVVFDMRKGSDRQLFIQRLLGDAAPTIEKGLKKVHLSTGSLPKVRSARNLGPKAAFGFSKNKTTSAESSSQDLLQGLTRERSHSDGPAPDGRRLNPSNEDSPTDSKGLNKL